MRVGSLFALSILSGNVFCDVMRPVWRRFSGSILFVLYVK